jgi:hypothetical protein
MTLFNENLCDVWPADGSATGDMLDFCESDFHLERVKPLKDVVNAIKPG